MMKIILLYLKILFIVSFGFLILNACKANQKIVMVPEQKVSMPEIRESVQATIVEIEEKPGVTENTEDVLQLSFLYSHKLNPKPDYEKSLDLMNNYISKVPKDKQFGFAEYIRSLLEQIKNEKKNLRNQKRLLRNEKKERKLITDKNNDLQKKILSLKKLDIRLEKQRLGVE